MKVLSLVAAVLILLTYVIELSPFYRNGGLKIFYEINFENSIFFGLSIFLVISTIVSCVALFTVLSKNNFRAIKPLASIALLTYFLSHLSYIYIYFIRFHPWNDQLQNSGWTLWELIKFRTFGNWTLISGLWMGYFELGIGELIAITRGFIVSLILIALVVLVFTSKIEIPQKVPSKTFFPTQVAEISTPSNTLTNPEGSSMDSNAQWKVKLPGQPDQSVDTATLQMWARSGVIRPDTLVQDVQNGMTYSATQIPTVFSSKSYVTALLLSFFIGYLGIDRFYLGHTGLGIGKLLTFGGCGIWALIDFILIAMRKVTDSQGNPLA